MKGFTRKIKPLEILSEEQVEAIYSATLDVLRTTGLTFHSEKALTLFKENGCEVDFEKRRVKFPEGLVEECLRKAPSSFRLKARDPKNDIILGANNFYFAAFPAMQTVDINTWEPRTPTLQEFIDGVKVLDALDYHHFPGNYTPYFGYDGVPSVMAITEGLALKLAYSSKPIKSEGASKGCEVFNIKIAKAVNAEFAGSVFSSAPLTYYSDAINSLFRHVEAGFPVVIGGGHVMGGTGPATLAGSLVLDFATNVAGIVLAQLVKSGTRVIQVDFTFPLNMRTGAPIFGGIEISLHQVAYFQIARRFARIPMFTYASGTSSSKRIDFQCGYEKAIMALTAALAGAHGISLHGGISSELTGHPLQAILDDDIAGMIGRFVEGIEVNDETLALDLIEKVGPIPGHYLNQEHTKRWWKKEFFTRKTADLLTYPEWKKIGRKSCLDYAKDRLQEILSTHEPEPLTDDQLDAIKNILEEAREYYRKMGMISQEEWEKYKKIIESREYPFK